MAGFGNRDKSREERKSTAAGILLSSDKKRRAEVFAELGLLRFENAKPSFPKGKRSDLSLSAIYRAVCALKER